MLQADSTLLDGLAHFYLGMAIVEKVDPAKPDPMVLKKATPHFQEAERFWQKTTKIAQSFSPLVGSEMRAKFERTSANVDGLRKTLSPLIKRVSAGEYPTVAECAESAAAVAKLTAPFEANAREVREK